MATRRRHTPEQIIRKLAESNKLLAGGAELDEVCRHLQIAESTWHRWLAQYGGMKANDAKRLKELETENVRFELPPPWRSQLSAGAGEARSNRCPHSDWTIHRGLLNSGHPIADLLQNWARTSKARTIPPCDCTMKKASQREPTSTL